MLALVRDVMVVRCVDADRRRSLVGRRFKTFFSSSLTAGQSKLERLPLLPTEQDNIRGSIWIVFGLIINHLIKILLVTNTLI
jgi:hypothetical protein